MAVKRVTSSKRDREKAKQSKREEKQKRKEERLSSGSLSLIHISEPTRRS